MNKNNNYKSNSKQRGRDSKTSKRAYRNGSPKEKDNKRDSADYAIKHDGNDPKWYAANEQLLRDAGSLAFSNNLGSIMPSMTSAPAYTSSFTMHNKSVPGLCTLYTASTAGVSNDNTSPINVAARNLYSYVRHANSGHSNYDSPDLMLYILAMNEAYAFWAYCVRMYGVMNTYSTFNRYYPKAIVSAMGCDWDDLQHHIADFRAFINQFAYKLGSICIPTSMSLFDRKVWMYSHLWVDDVCKKPQTYMYSPSGFWKYSEQSNQDGGELLWESIDLSTKLTFEDIRSLGERLIDPILGSEDLMIMSGDILKAFGEGNIYKVSSIAENYVVYPEFSSEVCAQIQNAEVLPNEIFALWQANAKIYQNPDTNAVISTFRVELDTTDTDFIAALYPIAAMSRKLLNFRNDSPTPGDVMVATRLKPWFTMQLVDDKYVFEMKECGSEIVISGRITYMQDDAIAGPIITEKIFTSYPVVPSGDSGVWAMEEMVNVAMLEKFDYHPIQYVHYRGAADNPYGTVRFVAYTGDLSNYTLMTSYEQSKMDNVALLSEFGAPTMGAFA